MKENIYCQLIKVESTDWKHLNGSEAFIEYLSDIRVIYKNI